jgi:hypothetical protein
MARRPLDWVSHSFALHADITDEQLRRWCRLLQRTSELVGVGLPADPGGLDAHAHAHAHAVMPFCSLTDAPVQLLAQPPRPPRHQGPPRPEVECSTMLRVRY